MNPKVAIFGSDADADLKRAFQELAAVLQLQAEFLPAEIPAGLVGTVIIQGSAEMISSTVSPFSKFQFVRENTTTENNAEAVIEFSDHVILPSFLRRQKITLGKESGWQFLDDQKPEEIVARINGRPVWRIAETSGTLVWSVSTPLPRLRAGERLAQLLNGETFLPLLPVYLFLRALSPESRWQAPPLRACMVVDDPNLHAQTYGHISYPALVQFAQKEPFHVAMATVPRDGWWTNRNTAKIFRENPRVLSLLAHGNDHLHHELARPFPNGERAGLVSQSLSRISFLENKKNVQVDRVMAPPHGVCAPEMFSALYDGGYDGMTTNRWSLWKNNPPEQLPANFGLQPADFFSGLPVLNRFRFKSSISDGEILMAALLGQPILPYGHHQDFANDMVHVRNVVGKINSIGPVRWMSLREILETNYEQYLDSGTLHLRLFSRYVKLTLPAGVKAIYISPVPLEADKSLKFEIHWNQTSIRVFPETRVSDLPPGVDLEIRALSDAPVTKSTGHTTFKTPMVGLRRLASEIRDRLKI